MHSRKRFPLLLLLLWLRSDGHGASREHDVLHGSFEHRPATLVRKGGHELHTESGLLASCSACCTAVGLAPSKPLSRVQILEKFEEHDGLFADA